MWMVEGRVSHVLPPLDDVLLARIPVPAKRTIKMYLSIVLDPSVTSRNVGIPWLTDVRGSFDNWAPLHYRRFVLNLSAGSNCIYQSSEMMKSFPTAGRKRQFSCRSSKMVRSAAGGQFLHIYL